MDTFLTKIANFSETAMWVVGALFVVDFVAILVCAYLTGTTDVEQRRVITRRGRPSGLIAGRYWSKSKALVSRPDTSARCPWSTEQRPRPSA